MDGLPINFTVYPAIDLRNGQVVRLRQGDPDRQKVYSTDPAQVASRWIAEGADWLHIVNLDAAFGELSAQNRKALSTIADVCGKQAKIQYGGGLRDLDRIGSILEAGASRVVVGTAAIENPTFAAQSLKQFGDRVVFALDADNGQLKTHGWQKSSTRSLVEFGRFLAKRGALTVIYTDISRDGMGQGVDWRTAADLAGRTGLDVIAAGGVASLRDIQRAKEAGLCGVIVGRALYDGRFTLQEAQSC